MKSPSRIISTLYRVAYRVLSPAELKSFERVAIEAFADRQDATRGFVARWRLLVWEIGDLLATRVKQTQARPTTLLRRRGVQATTGTLQYSLRTLRRNPGFALAAVVTLGLGIGLATSIFGVVNGVLLNPLPYGNESSIVVVTNSTGEGRLGLSEKESIRYRELHGTFQHLGVYWFDGKNIYGHESGAARLTVGVIDANVIPALGVTPVIGRNFTAAEDYAGGPNAVILGHSFWVSRYDGDLSVLGQTVSLDGSSYDIVGVMPKGFKLPLDFTGSPVSLYVPAAIGIPDERNIHYLNSVARLLPGATVESASAAVAETATSLIGEYGTLPGDFNAYVIPVRDEAVGSARTALLILLTSVGFVFLIACVNVANLMLARTDQRRRELAIRQALGAGRGSLLGLIIGEAGMVAVLGGALGVLASYVGVQALVGASPAGIPRLDGVGFDVRVVLFAVCATALAAILCGLAPAITGVAEAEFAGLGDGARGTADVGRQRGRRALLAAEVALAVALTTGAGLTTKSLLALTSVDTGFDEQNVLTMRVNLTGERYTEQRAARDFYSRLLERLRGYGGVSSAGAARSLPLASTTGDWGIRIRGTGPDGLGERGPKADWHVVTDGFFEALGVPLIEGRFFEVSDRAGNLNAVIVNETMADRYWAGGSALGAQFRMTTDIDTIWRTVVGVVGDVKQASLDEDIPTAMYLPHSQFPSTADWSVGPMTLVVRTAGDPKNMARVVAEEIGRLDPEVPVSSVQTMDDVVSQASERQRFQGLLIGTFAVAALVLVCVGVYGVTSYLISRRFKEMGIRVALGASPGGVVRLLIGEGAVVVALGIVLGLAVTVVLSRAMSSFLFGVTYFDFEVYVSVTAMVATTVLAAVYLPASKATRVDPAKVLRDE